jgi:F-type H+-transporting ATPase subunit b
MARRLLAAFALLGLVASFASGVAAAPEVDPEHGVNPSPGGHPPHGDEHGVPKINWYQGILGERAGVEPDLLWRSPGMPVPYAVLALNSFLLFGLLYAVGRKPVMEALKRRKARIMHGMEDAARMKVDAARRLAEYEEKLEGIEHEIERVRHEMRESAEAERARILREARERRQRMEREARLLIEQELKAAREMLYREAVAAAVDSAANALAVQVNAADQQRLARDYLSVVRDQGQSLRGKV